jgi:hypothetical protein
MEEVDQVTLSMLQHAQRHELRQGKEEDEEDQLHWQQEEEASRFNRLAHHNFFDGMISVDYLRNVAFPDDVDESDMKKQT